MFSTIQELKDFQQEMMKSNKIVWSLPDYSADSIPDGDYQFEIDNEDYPVKGNLIVKNGEFDFEIINAYIPSDYKANTQYWYIEGFELSDEGVVIFSMGS
jgi:hypothetical protein